MIGDDYANYDIVNYNNSTAKVRNNNIDSNNKDNTRKIKITITFNNLTLTLDKVTQRYCLTADMNISLLWNTCPAFCTTLNSSWRDNVFDLQ